MARARGAAAVLALLHSAGSSGVHHSELVRARIGDPRTRVSELRADGHVVEVRKERDAFGVARGTRYFLRPPSGGDAAA